MHQLRDNAKLPLRSFSIRKLQSGRIDRVNDEVAVEEPLDVRLSYWMKDVKRTESLALAMRTPGDERELAAGLLLSEGVVTKLDEIQDIRYLGAGDSHNEILAELAPGVDVEAWRLKRNTFLSSSCGICGKATLEQLSVPKATGPGHLRISDQVLFSLPDSLAARQRAFAHSGALHAAALVTSDGRLEEVFEDIGRHNALDKLLGWCLLKNRVPLSDKILLLSSRSSFELVQKTAMAGGTILATIGGPSSLAIETARALGITLVGFLRDGRCNVYSGEWRVDSN